MSLYINDAEAEALVNGRHGQPFNILGPHPVPFEGGTAMAVRAFLPHTKGAQVIVAGHEEQSYEMIIVHPTGLYEAIIAWPGGDFKYRIHQVHDAGSERTYLDPYAFPPLLGDMDIYLFGEGTLIRSYDKLGAHIRAVNGVRGVQFVVWAPNAQRVSLVGDFNQWNGAANPMRQYPGAGLWEIFMPEFGAGEVYKYEILSRFNNYVVSKADPYGFAAELRPKTASIVADLDQHQWQDGDWLQNRAQHNGLNSPISIYEVHLGSWRRVPEDGNRWMTYREFADQLVPYVKQMGYTHVELLPLSEHPFDGSWGYQTVGYFAATSRFGSPEDLMALIDLLHQNGIGVFLDWVPAHFPKDQHGLNYFDGTHLYEHGDPRLGEHPDWGTLIFNFGRNEVRNFLLSNALFWLDKYHIDGLRVDAVASLLYLDFSRKEGEWIPNQFGGRENLAAIDFLRRFNELVHGEYPTALTSAEDSTAWPMVTRPTYIGGLGFDFKWNMGWMHDMIDYIELDPIYRRYHHNKLTFSLMYAFNENFILPFSHDEVVHLKKSMIAKMPGDVWQKFANLRALYGYMFTHPGKKLLFMGQEFGQWDEWSHEHSLDWNLLEYDNHRQLQSYVAALNHVYSSEAALNEVESSWEGFQWLVVTDNENSVLAFVRRARNPADFVIVVCSFTPLARYDYRFGVPRGGYYQEILNSDAAAFGGSNIGNGGGAHAWDAPLGDWSHTLSLTIPPLATLILKPEPLPAPAPVEEQPAAAPEQIAAPLVAESSVDTTPAAPAEAASAAPETGDAAGAGG